MKKLLMTVAALVVVFIVLAGAAQADTTFSWSDPNNQSGTLTYSGLNVTNSTFQGTIVSGSTLSGNGAGLTNLDASKLTAGNMALARWSNIAATAGITIGAWNINAATNVPAGNLVGNIDASKLVNNAPLASATNALAAARAAGFPWVTNAGVSNVVLNAYGQIVTIF